MASPEDLRRALSAASPEQPDNLYRAVAAAVRGGQYEAARDTIAGFPARLRNEARFQQQLGLAHRGLLDSADAHAAFARAARLAPADPLIAHSLARTALEAGAPALALFDAARQLAPGDGAVQLGRAAAQLAEGCGAAACVDLAAVLRKSPGWFEGHLTFAKLAAILARGDAPGQTLREALARNPASTELWRALIRVSLGAYDYPAAREQILEARHALGDNPELGHLDAHCLSELGEASAAQQLFDRLPLPDNGVTALPVLRNLIRLGRYDQALRLAALDFPAPGDMAVWPYRALLWRLTGDARWDWLEGDERLIRTYDISAGIGSLDDLAVCLRAVHRGSQQPLDQSVRGGTQTDGMLFARAEPEIRRLRSAVDQAVRDYVAQLPPPDPAHPSLPAIRDPLRYEGAWSVRLDGSGYHHDHVHTHGWVSSACYIVLPDTRGDQAEAGWLTFGENRRLLPDLEAFRTVEPALGHLVLFPSTMWHGTRPFSSGERLTVAFDIARPRG